ncbi:MAG: Acg family FMN-binding oxidoreductase [Segniliparus sp.]|uniref:Acg family FMN-binding oxidoreductase n=1 Tax=Segniliparus sp. TaxID=2804064 RepID=UPI003F2BCAB2
MSRTFPDEHTVTTAVSLAARAPSVHNTQPWLWRAGRESVRLDADPARRLVEADPDGRDLLLSCGAALHHCQVAFAALGWSSETRRLPNPAKPDHLATITLHRHQPTSVEVGLSAAISARRSDRRAYSPEPVDAFLLESLARRAAAHGAVLQVADEAGCGELVAATLRAAQRHLNDPSYRCELARWSGKHFADEGVPAANTPPVTPGAGGIPGRRFSNPWLWGASPQGAEKAGGELLTLSTTEDDRSAQLRAGEAMSAVLLEAASSGLAACPLSEALELRDTRDQIRERVTGGLHPQIVLRLGWPLKGLPPLIETYRRPAHDILAPLSAAQLDETRV